MNNKYNKNLYKIEASLINLAVGNFKSDKDKEAFDIFAECLYSMDKGIVITPIYNEEDGKLMSFIVDSKEAAKIIDNRMEENGSEDISSV